MPSSRVLEPADEQMRPGTTWRSSDENRKPINDLMRFVNYWLTSISRVRPRPSLPHPPTSPAASTWPRNPDLRVHLPQPSRRRLPQFPAPATSHALLWRHRARGECPSTSGATESSG